ncbi:MAG: hypothetical protein Q4B78_04980 [Bacillota bacterium]|nr:hypothetical protein [Bacillota bacterium]
MKKSLLTILGILILALGVAMEGCSNQPTATLEDLAESDSNIAKTINDEIETPKGMKVSVEFSGDSFDIIYTYKDKRSKADNDRLVKAFESNTDELKEGWEEAISNLETQTDITGIVGTIIIRNSNEEDLWTYSFPERQ